MANIDTMDLFNDAMKQLNRSNGKVEQSTKYNGDQSLTFTPVWVVNGMLDMLPDQVWNEHTTFLDISCKTGVFLVEIFKRLDKVLKVIPEFEDDKVRREYILNKQLYGLTLDDNMSLMMSRRNLTGNAFSGNIKYIGYSNKSYIDIIKSRNEKILKDLVKEEFGQMNFDVVVGNPPYNNDMYLDFARGGQLLQSKYELLITPAKWQAKGGQKNEDFRKNIVPYMSKIVYYPVATDIFNIKEWDGITYFLSVKDRISETKEIINISKWQNKFNNSSIRQLGESLNNSFVSILNKVRDSKNFNELSINYEIYFDCRDVSFIDDKNHTIEVLGGDSQGNMQIDGYANIDSLKHKDDVNKYKLIMHSMPGRNSTLVSDGTTYGNSEVKIIGKDAVCKDAYIVLATSDSIEELKYILSYFNTKFVRSLTYCGCVGTNARCNEYWRFVPDPGAFDHIFTDQELYKKYNLTDDEINIIESVIKERK